MRSLQAGPRSCLCTRRHLCRRLATIEFHRHHRLAERSAELGSYLSRGLTELAGRTRRLALPRGLGLMAGADVVDEEGKPDPARMDLLLEDLKDRGFLCGKTGAERNVLTLMPPLTVARADLDDLLEALHDSFTVLEKLS